MATVADNIMGMADLVATAKRNYRLSETTILKIVEFNLSLMSQRQNPFEDDVDFGEPAPEETVEDNGNESNLIPFPLTPEIEAAAEPTEE